MLQGGGGDADGMDALASHLVDRYTVLSYDRRGLSRSTLDGPSAALDLSTHSDDASRLLTAVTDEPVLVFGASLGALLGLDLIARHPEQVRLLVAHEPPATELLPEPERDEAVRGQEEVEALYRREGVGAAMRKFVAIAGVNHDDREPGVDIGPPKPERIANLVFFLTHDAPAVRRYRLDLAGLHAFAGRIVPAAGQTPGDGFARRCTQALADELGRPLVEFPGGHAGSVLRPRAFAARLAEVLDASGGASA
ncbi:MAG TPA: alpha/beta hydrolase [Acidimicrobiales bacterium]|nr:alpha/beta hydrolase [Acidimicrobiales bacterium]